MTETPRRLVPLDHVIEAGMTTYPGLPAPEITDHLTRDASRGVYAEGTTFAIGRISMVGNTGTYLDSPFHRYDDERDLAWLPLQSVADVATLVVRVPEAATGSHVPGGRGIGPEVFDGHQVAGRAVLIHTGWDVHWRTPAYGVGAPFLNEAGAAYLVEQGATLVGIDSVNIDDTESGGHRPAHSLLLAAGVPVLEHLTGLADLPITGARLHAAPPRVAGFGTFPVRAYAVVEGR